jgi:hypothetical protein
VNFFSSDQTEYWQKWTYQVSNFSAQQLIKTIDDFLVQKETITSNNDTIYQTVDEGDSLN